MSGNNLIIDLDIREDKKNNIYYIGRLKSPINIDLTEGVTLLVFTSDSGDEELQIAVNDKENSVFSSVKNRNGRLDVKLEKRKDKKNRSFYVAKLMMNAYVRCHDEVVFMIFTSREGSEEIQIVGDIRSAVKNSKIEVIRKRIIN